MLLTMPTKYAISQVVYKVLARFKVEVERTKEVRVPFIFLKRSLVFAKDFSKIFQIYQIKMIVPR